MSSLSQYTDIYRDHRETLDSHSAPVINALRQEAFDALKGKSLPDRNTEGYEKTSIEEMWLPTSD